MTDKELKQKGMHAIRVLTDKNESINVRAGIMAQLCADESPEGQAILDYVLAAAGSGSATADILELQEHLRELITELRTGPVRIGMYQEKQPNGNRVRVTMEDGATGLVVVTDQKLAANLKRGDTVAIDKMGMALLFKIVLPEHTGTLAQFERQLPGDRIEVREGCNKTPTVMRATAALSELLATGEVVSGRQLVVNAQKRIAYEVLPQADLLENFRHLIKAPIPHLNMDQIGAPPAYIKELIEIVRMEMTQPELRARYKLPSCTMKMLAGPSGTGKSYSIYALWHEMYRAMSEIVGVPMDELPARVLKLRMPQVLSQWLGESDKNLDRFFNEVEQIADTKFTKEDGTEYNLPTLCIMEEVDGLARSRGGDTSGVYDRIMTTALERLDTSRPELRGKLILFIATTNVPELVDVAMMRRVGGTIEHFGRLKEKEFMEVLDKQLADRPVAKANGTGREELIATVTKALYGPIEKDIVQLELKLQGSGKLVSKYRRDFLTASVVDRAMQTAAASAAKEEYDKKAKTKGITVSHLLVAITKQIDGIVRALHEATVKNYIDLPDGAQVEAINRPQHTVALETT